MAMPAVSIGNYKGVMLCNRPFASTGGGDLQQKGGNGSRQAFVCGNVGETWGANVVINASKERCAKPLKKTNALVKHKKWLEELQRSKLELEKEALEKKKKKDGRRKRFMKREADMRAFVREKQEEVPETTSSVGDSEEKLRERPAWALTEKEAEEALDLADVDEAEDLVDFARSLDFEKYINDAEVSSLIDSVRARVKDLERSKDPRPDRVEGQVTALTADNLKTRDKDDDDLYDSQPKDDDAASTVASKFLDDDKQVAFVHSKKSLTAMANKNILDTLPEEPTMAEPRVINHNDDNRLDIKSDIAKLPYMHRNPAV